MRGFAALATAAGIVGMTLLGASLAEAQSCFNMQAELMRLQNQGQSGDTARYERAYREQANVLANTEARARNAGCFGSGFFLFRREPDRSCRELIPKIRQMQDNLARLDRLRRRPGSDNAYRIQELQGMMSARGCDIPGGSVFVTTPQDNLLYDPNNPYFGGNTFRTLCVRTCDGYYFPISFSTTPDRFPADAQTCQAMCPGTQAMLFYYPNPGGGPENMVSVDGIAYSSLPTAFKYRTSLDASCTCKPPGGYSTAMSEAPAVPVPLDPTAPPPIPRPAPGEDPETLADRAGDFVPHVVADDSAAAAGETSHSMRIVGPPLGNAAQDALMLSPVPN